MQALKDKKYMIVGAGLTGLSVARWCVRNGYDFDLCDTRTGLANAENIRNEFSTASLFLGELDVHRLIRYEQLRSEERRVGKECRSRLTLDDLIIVLSWYHLTTQ